VLYINIEYSVRLVESTLEFLIGGMDI